MMGLTETGKSGGCRELGEEEASRYYLMGTEVQFCKLKKVLETDGSDVCTVM